MPSITGEAELREMYPGWRDLDYHQALDSNLVMHAMRELSGLSYPGTDEINRMMAYHIMDLVEAFSWGAHSGSSAAYTVETLQRLMNFENLKPLTSSEREWIEVGDGLWQNVRNSSAFSNNAGRTYYLLGERRRWVRHVPHAIVKRLTNRVWNLIQFPIHAPEQP